MDSAIDTATSEHRLIGSVDDGIDYQGRDVGSFDMDPMHGHES